MLLAESFDGFPTSPSWQDGSVHGAWRVGYTGFGRVGIESDGSRVAFVEPKVSTRAGETHAALLLSRQTFGDFDLTLRLKTSQQLRVSGPPRAWEVGWVLWHYLDDNHFYYLVLKRNGWEIGKADPAYRGGQRYLGSHDYPRYSLGAWHAVRVRQVGGKTTIWADGRRLANVFDHSHVYVNGRVGLYAEDAHVRFDDVWVTAAN